MGRFMLKFDKYFSIFILNREDQFKYFLNLLDEKVTYICILKHSFCEVYK